MDEHQELRVMIEEGKDKLEWYRQVQYSTDRYSTEQTGTVQYRQVQYRYSAIGWFTKIGCCIHITHLHVFSSMH